jgi:hypothetical protein
VVSVVVKSLVEDIFAVPLLYRRRPIAEHFALPSFALGLLQNWLAEVWDKGAETNTFVRAV